MIKVSHGALDFRTKPSHFGAMGGKIRLLAEKKQCHTLYIGIEETMTASLGSYSQELFDISRRVFDEPYIEIIEPKFLLDKLFDYKHVTNDNMREMFKEVITHYGTLDGYTMVKGRELADWYYTIDCEEYARRLMIRANRQKVPADTFLLERQGGMCMLYVRTAFLESFPVGREVLNYTWLVERMKGRRKEKNNLEKRLNEYIKNYG